MQGAIGGLAEFFMQAWLLPSLPYLWVRGCALSPGSISALATDVRPCRKHLCLAGVISGTAADIHFLVLQFLAFASFCYLFVFLEFSYPQGWIAATVQAMVQSSMG